MRPFLFCFISLSVLIICSYLFLFRNIRHSPSLSLSSLLYLVFLPLPLPSPYLFLSKSFYFSSFLVSLLLSFIFVSTPIFSLYFYPISNFFIFASSSHFFFPSDSIFTFVSNLLLLSHFFSCFLSYRLCITLLQNTFLLDSVLSFFILSLTASFLFDLLFPLFSFHHLSFSSPPFLHSN